MGSGTRCSQNTIAFGFRLRSCSHRIFANQAPHDTYWRNNQIKDRPKNDSGVDPAENLGQRHPASVNPRQTARPYEGGDNQQSGGDRSPDAGIPTADHDRPERNRREHTAHRKTERPKGFSGYDLLHGRIILFLVPWPSPASVVKKIRQLTAETPSTPRKEFSYKLLRLCDLCASVVSLLP